jgi:hypothetical protein
MSFGLGFWAAAGAGVATDYELISTTILGSSAASVSFTGLGTSAVSYKHLQIRYMSNGDNSNYRNRLRLNGDSGSNYATHLLFTTGSSVMSAAGTSATEIALSQGANETNKFYPGIIDLLDFQSSTKNKTVRAFNGGGEVSLTSGVWLSTSAVTSVSLRPDAGNFITGSRFSLYGIKG